jgi:N-formylmaleamate deformylase
MINFAEGAVSANGVTLHYYRSTARGSAGSGRLSRNRPPLTVMLLHGITDNALCWSRVTQALEEYHLVVPDARGHGFSQAPEMGYGVEERAADVADLIRVLEIDHPVMLGHSMGAETAIAVAGLYPDLVRGAILEDPPWPGRFWGSTMEERRERADQWQAEIRLQKSKSKEALIAEAREKYPVWPKEELDPWAEAKQQVSPLVTNMVLATRRRWNDYLRQAQCPVLLLTGDPERGAIVTEQTAREAAQYWKDGRTVHISGAGHSIHREQFRPYIHAVKEFLARIKT